MGSINPPSSSSSEAEEITVLVTGFAPFRAQNPINPAWEIARSLPPYLPQSSHSHPDPNSNTTKTSNTIRSFLSPKVRILIHPEAIKVGYEAVRELVPKLWAAGYGEAEDAGREDAGDEKAERGKEDGEARKSEKRNKIDYMIHIGMASGRKWHSIERRGHRDGYALKDVDGKICEDTLRRLRQLGVTAKPNPQWKDEDNDEGADADADGEADKDGDGEKKEKQKQEERDKWIWEGLPAEIKTDIDVDDVWRRWRLSLPNHDLRISEDAGHYLCDFIFYSSLAELTKRDEKRRVIFLHVPVESDEQAIKKGVDITCELIRAVVASERLKGLVGLGRS